MKRILFITAFTPSDIAAAEKNTKMLLEDLGKSYYVDLVFFAYDNDVNYSPISKNIHIKEKILINKIQKLRNVFMYPILHPLFTAKFNYGILNRLKRLTTLQKYDLVICDHSQMFLYAKYLDSSIPKFLICHDVIYQRISRLKGKLMTYICKKSEEFALNVKNSYIFSFSEKDCKLINTIYGIKANLILDYIDDKIVKSSPSDVKYNEFSMMANWRRSDNIDGLRWFVQYVTPLINEQTVIHIIGSHLPNDINFEINDKVKYVLHGFVEDPYPLISNCQAFISPLFTGAGIKVKVIEALACGVPVIGTDISFEGFDSKYSKFMMTFNNEKECQSLMKKEFTLSERVDMKNLFLSTFRSQTVPSYIELFKI